MSLIVSIEGDDKTGKSSLALSSVVEGPVLYLEQDIGGFDRAAPRFHLAISRGEILCEQFPPVVQRAALGVDNSLLLRGVRESWEAIIIKYLGAIDGTLQAPNGQPFKNVVMEGGLLWSICHRGYLQELQESTPDKTRAKLIEIMYTEPNSRYESFLAIARPAGINLILTHKLDDEYTETGQFDDRGKSVKARSGKRIAKGWKHLDQWVDIVVRLEREDFTASTRYVVPKATVRLSGVMGMTGMEFSYRKVIDKRASEYTEENPPTWENIIRTWDTMRKMQELG